MFDSSDLDGAVEGVVDAIYFNQGTSNLLYPLLREITMMTSVQCWIMCNSTRECSRAAGQ